MVGTRMKPLTLQKWLTRLADPDPKVRCRAAGMVGGSRDPATVPLLLGTLATDPGSSVRAKAARSLGRMKDSRAVGPLIEALHDRSRGVRAKAAQALGFIGDTSVCVPLIAALADSCEGVRIAAAQALGLLADPCVVEPLLSLLQDPSESVQCISVVVLGSLGEQCVAQPLLAYMLNTVQRCSSRVRSKWASALSNVCDNSTFGQLLCVLNETAYSWQARALVARALGLLKQSEAVEPLLASLRDEDVAVRYQAVLALGTLADSRAVEPLFLALKEARNYETHIDDCGSEIHVAEAIFDALSQIGDRGAVEPLIALLFGRPKNLTVISLRLKWALQALDDLMRDSSAIDPLFWLSWLFEAGWEDYYCWIVRALGRLGDRRAIEPLRTALDQKLARRNCIEAAQAMLETP